MAKKVQVQYVRSGKVTSMLPHYAKTLEALKIVRPYEEPVKKTPRKKAAKKTERDLKAGESGGYETRDLKADD